MKLMWCAAVALLLLAGCASGTPAAAPATVTVTVTASPSAAAGHTVVYFVTGAFSDQVNWLLPDGTLRHIGSIKLPWKATIAFPAGAVVAKVSGRAGGVVQAIACSIVVDGAVADSQKSLNGDVSCSVDI